MPHRRGRGRRSGREERCVAGGKEFRGERRRDDGGERRGSRWSGFVTECERLGSIGLRASRADRRSGGAVAGATGEDVRCRREDVGGLDWGGGNGAALRQGDFRCDEELLLDERLPHHLLRPGTRPIPILRNRIRKRRELTPAWCSSSRLSSFTRLACRLLPCQLFVSCEQRIDVEFRQFSRLE